VWNSTLFRLFRIVFRVCANVIELELEIQPVRRIDDDAIIHRLPLLDDEGNAIDADELEGDAGGIDYPSHFDLDYSWILPILV